jgi:hypothetical protein
MIKSLVTEYGLPWLIYRSLYSAKLQMMRAIPASEKLFEKKVEIKQLDLIDLNTTAMESFLCNLSSNHKTEIITVADNAMNGKIKGFSSIELDYGNPIDWHYNPLTQKKIDKNVKWYQIPDFDPQRGDIKVIWEASRLTHFFYFVRAFMITKDIKYYHAFSNQLNDWLLDNKYAYGANFKCGQEASLRMINTLFAYSAFKSYQLLIKRDEENVRKLVEISYKKVLSNFFYAHKCIKNNHTLSEIAGLIIGAWCSNDQRRLKKAYQLLDKEIQQQFLPDGGYIQYSFNYQRFALQIMELVLKLSHKTKMNISEQSLELLKNSALLLYQMQDDTGDVPNYGSNDGALIFPVTVCDYRDYRSVINTILALLNNKRVFDPGYYDEELLWFSDNTLQEIQVSKINRASVSFVTSGFFSLRQADSFLMTVLQNFKTRPAQMDQLHLDLWYKGKNILCDSGTYSYATELGKQLALTSAHNTAVVPGKEQMKKRDPFLIYDWTKTKNIKHDAESFHGTMVSKNGYEHTRSIKKTTTGYLISDEVRTDANYCQFHFHTPCEVILTSTGFGLLDQCQLICQIVTNGTVEVTKTYRSLYYLKKDEINRISVRSSNTGNKCSMQFEIKLVG